MEGIKGVGQDKQHTLGLRGWANQIDSTMLYLKTHQRLQLEQSKEMNALNESLGT